MVEVFAFVLFFSEILSFFFVLLFGVRSATLRCLVLRAYFFSHPLVFFFPVRHVNQKWTEGDVFDFLLPDPTADGARSN